MVEYNVPLHCRMETPWKKSRSSRLQVQHLRADTEGGNPLPGAAELLGATHPPTPRCPCEGDILYSSLGEPQD